MPDNISPATINIDIIRSKEEQLAVTNTGARLENVQLSLTGGMVMIQSCRRPRPGCGRARATRRNAPCAYGARCIHGMGCWGVHLPGELAIFRRQQELACGVCEIEQHRDISADIAEASAQIGVIVERVVDGWRRVETGQEFFDAPLIPRRRKHRRTRKRQRARYRRLARQMRQEQGVQRVDRHSVAVQTDSQVETEDEADAETWRGGYRLLAKQLDSERQRSEELEENLAAEEAAFDEQEEKLQQYYRDNQRLAGTSVKLLDKLRAAEEENRGLVQALEQAEEQLEWAGVQQSLEEVGADPEW